MNRPSALLTALLIAWAFAAPAQGPEDQYVRIYNLIQQADTLNSSGQFPLALPKYLEAQTALQSIQKSNPDWNPRVVNFRLNYLSDKINAGATTNAPAPLRKAVPEPAVPTPSPPAAPTEAKPAPPAPPAPAQPQVTALQNDVNRLQSEKAVLEAKLKEALTTQPAAVDPRELAKAQEKIQSLLKENALLKTSLDTQQEKLTPGAQAKEVEYLKMALADANNKLTEQLSRANTLRAEQEQTQKQPGSVANTNELAALKQSLDEANQKLATQTASAGKLTTERDSLLGRVNALTASAATADTLRAENAVLKQQLSQVSATSSPSASEANRRRAKAEAQLAALQSDAQVLRLEKLALENRFQKLAVPTVAAQPATPNEIATQRIRQLERERDEQRGRASQELVAKVDQLTKEVTGLRARVEVFEAPAIPYTAEELALFNLAPPEAATADPDDGRKSIRALPPGSAALVASAQRNFAAKDYDKAEADYLEILHKDEHNPNTLANLAAIQLEMGRLDEAEKNIKLALTTAPNDGYNLSILGYVKYRQGKYDDALAALSRAAKAIPQSAEIQNYLGVTLSQKGLRGPAETALRKAIQIDPKYSDAQNNLAVIYASQTPPLLELARWHYQKALDAGHPKNPELEKLFEKKETTTK